MKEIKQSEITVSELQDLVAIHCPKVELKEKEATQRLLDILKPVILKNAQLFSGDDHEKIYAQTYPNPDSKVLPREMRDELIWAKRHSFIGEKTKIVSLGSCFAKEIAKWLQRNGFRYVTTDSSPVDADGIKLSSAGWGAIFNSPAVYQTVKWAFNSEDRPNVIYEGNGKYTDRYLDPFLDEFSLAKNEIGDYESETRRILADSRVAFETADVVVITVGLNEVFQLLPTPFFFHRTPWGINPAYFKAIDLDVEQNVGFLVAAITELRRHNPSVKIIISVSPIPLLRSFHKERHVAESTALSKAVLRLAVNEVVTSLPDVFYFGSFETVMYPGQDIALLSDDRHVRHTTVSKIMRAFVSCFCDEDTRAAFLFDEDARCVYHGIKNFIATLPAESQSLKSVTQLEDALRLHLPPGIANSEHGYKLYRTVSSLTQLKLTNSIGEVFVSQVREDTLCPETHHLEKTGVLHICNEFNLEELEAVHHFLDSSQCISQDTGEEIRLSECLDHSRMTLGENQTGIYRYSPDCLTNATILSVVAGAGVYELAKQYLGRIGYLHVQGWRSLPIQNKSAVALSEAAQLYHYDLDSVGRFLKVFIALTDITPRNGPFHFVEGSHNLFPRLPRPDGRYSDQEIASLGAQIFIGSCSRGDVIVADTRGLHKGAAVLQGYRDIIQIEIGQSRYGKNRVFNTPKEFQDWLS